MPFDMSTAKEVPTGGFDINTAQPVEDENQSVYRPETGKTVLAPRGVDAATIEYLDDTQNNKRPIGNHIGFVDVVNMTNPVMAPFVLFGKTEAGQQLKRGAAGMAASAPAIIAGAELKRTGELYQDVFNRSFGVADVGNMVNPFANSGSKQASINKVLNYFGMDTSKTLDFYAGMAEAGDGVLKKNQEFIDKHGLSKRSGDGVFYDMGSTGTTALSAMAVTFLTKNPGYAAAFFGELQRSSGYVEARDAELSPVSSDRIAGVMGAAEAGLEVLGGNLFLKAAGVDKVVTRIIVRAANEALQEASQAAAEEAITQSTGVRDVDIVSALKNIGYSAILGFIVGALGGAVTSLIEKQAAEAGIPEGVSKAFAQKMEQSAPAIQEAALDIVKREGSALASDPNNEAEAAKIMSDFANGNAIEPASEQQPSIEQRMQDFVNAQEDGVLSAPKRAYEEFSYGLSRFLEPISTRVRTISEPLFYRLRSFEMATKQAINNDMAQIIPFLDKWRKLDKTSRKELDFALKNGNADLVAQKSAEFGIEKELAAIRPVLDSIFQKATAAGIKTEYRADFFPRKIKNLNKLLEHLRKTESWSVFNQAFENKEAQIGRKLTAKEKEDIINTLIRGFKTGDVSLKDAGVFGKRTIEEIDAELNKFYESTDQALLSYIVTANENIETNKLFGKNIDTADEASVNDSVGALLAKMVESGEITDSQASNLKDALGARFNRGRMSQTLSAIKNAGYAATMGSNFGSTLRQIADLGVSAARYGAINAGMSAAEVVSGKGVVSLKELGIEKIAQEFENATYSGRVLEDVFKWTGLDAIDKLGKRTLVQAAYNDIVKKANNNDAELVRKLGIMFGSGHNSSAYAEQVKRDIIGRNITKEVKIVLFNELLDAQPVALSEMPEMYLRSGNGRIFYMLKSFTIRQVDLIRRESIQKMRKGIVNNDSKMFAEGLGNGFRLLAFLTAMNIGIDYIWDFIKHLPDILRGDDYEPPEISDEVTENILKSFGLNKYSFDQMNRPYLPNTPSDALFDIVAPPTKTTDNLWRDITALKNGKIDNPSQLRTLRSIPVGGELYWFWFGGGSEQNKQKTKPKGFK